MFIIMVGPTGSLSLSPSLPGPVMYLVCTNIPIWHQQLPATDGPPPFSQEGGGGEGEEIYAKCNKEMDALLPGYTV